MRNSKIKKQHLECRLWGDFHDKFKFLFFYFLPWLARFPLLIIKPFPWTFWFKLFLVQFDWMEKHEFKLRWISTLKNPALEQSITGALSLTSAYFFLNTRKTLTNMVSLNDERWTLRKPISCTRVVCLIHFCSGWS